MNVSDVAVALNWYGVGNPLYKTVIRSQAQAYTPNIKQNIWRNNNGPCQRLMLWKLFVFVKTQVASIVIKTVRRSSIHRYSEY